MSAYNNKELRVTTADNPYNPFTHWEQWLLYDTNAGYNTCGRLASITFLHDSMTEEEIYESVDHGIDQLIKTGALNKQGEIVEFKKVIKESNKK